jgi:hypothetical protein
MAEALMPAPELYTGLQHQRLMEGVRVLQNAGQGPQLDLYILSAGYGLVPADAGWRPTRPPSPAWASGH